MSESKGAAFQMWSELCSFDVLSFNSVIGRYIKARRFSAICFMGQEYMCEVRSGIFIVVWCYNSPPCAFANDYPVLNLG